MQVHSYINFDGRCEEALDFYKKALGAQVEFMMRNEETPEPPPPGMLAPGSEKKVLHVQFRIGDTVLMGSDGCAKGDAKFEGISLNLFLEDVAQSERYFKALSEGGQVKMPLSKTFFSPSFAMLTDRFGIHWMIYVAPKQK